MGDTTIILDGGGAEYDIAEAQVSIDDLIRELQEAKEDGAEYVVLPSGNYRGARWLRLRANYEWAEDEG